MKRALLLLFVPVLVRAEAKPAPPAMGPPSRAVTNEIVDAVAEEMHRQMTSLELGGFKPYHIAYKITEVDVNDVAASLGQTTSRRNRHFVNLEVRVRVGSAAFDNTNFVVPQADEIDGVFSRPLPLEATPKIASREAWLVTDQAFKEAIMQFRAKEEARRASGASRPLDIPSFSPLSGQAPVSKADPKEKEPKKDAPKDLKKPAPSLTPGPYVVVNDEPVLVPVLEGLDELETRAKSL